MDAQHATSDVDRLYAARWPNGRKPWPLGETQLAWCRKQWPKFKKWEAGARRVLRETDASRDASRAAEVRGE
jgi:hypothetical protein